MQFRITGLLLLGAIALPAAGIAQTTAAAAGNHTNRGCRNQTA